MLYKKALISCLCLFYFSVFVGSEQDEFAILSSHRSGFQFPERKPRTKNLIFQPNNKQPDVGVFIENNDSEDLDADSIEIKVSVRSKKGIIIDSEKLKKALQEFSEAVDRATEFTEKSKKSANT